VLFASVHFLGARIQQKAAHAVQMAHDAPDFGIFLGQNNGYRDLAAILNYPAWNDNAMPGIDAPPIGTAQGCARCIV